MYLLINHLKLSSFTWSQWNQYISQVGEASLPYYLSLITSEWSDYSSYGKYLPFLFFFCFQFIQGFPCGAVGKGSTCQGRRGRFNPWVRNIPWSRKWKSSLVFLPGKHRGPCSTYLCFPKFSKRVTTFWEAQKYSETLIEII